jgi:hypothetical protein
MMGRSLEEADSFGMEKLRWVCGTVRRWWDPSGVSVDLFQFFSSFGPYPENPSRNVGTDNDAHRFGS